MSDPLQPEELEDPLAPASGAPAPTIDAARYRRVLGYFATGVTVVTGVEGDQPLGLSVNSFTSVSLDPPLVAFCAARSSSSWARMRASGTFCVNILSDDQEEVCRVFAGRGGDKFRGIGWRASETGAPIIAGALAWIDCAVEAAYEAGDHHIVVGRVLDLDVARDGRPLVFFRGGYGRFEP